MFRDTLNILDSAYFKHQLWEKANDVTKTQKLSQVAKTDADKNAATAWESYLEDAKRVPVGVLGLYFIVRSIGNKIKPTKPITA